MTRLLSVAWRSPTLRFVGRRLTHAVPLLLGISLMSFFLMSLAPGDYLARMRANPQISRETIQRMEVDFGLRVPVIDEETGEPALDPETGEPVLRRTTWLYQYSQWLKSILLRWDFGFSFSTRQPVWNEIGGRLLNTLFLSIAALVVGLLLALPLGIYSATRQYRWQDIACSFFAFIGLSIPNVFLALLVIMFAASTDLLPINGIKSIDFDEFTTRQKLLDLLHHVIGPALVLGTAIMAIYMRQMRGNLLDVLESDYIRTARAKGLSERTVVVRHGARNAINPVITLFGFSLSDLLSGSILVEYVFAWPGLGQVIVQATLNKDIYLVMAAVMMASVLLIIGNLIADILLACNDPRIRMR